jgi:hypothetical protein
MNEAVKSQEQAPAEAGLTIGGDAFSPAQTGPGAA